MVKGYRKMCRTGMEVGALVNSTVDSMSLGPNCDALFFLCVLARGFGAFTNALFFALEDSVVPWKFHCQFIMGDKLAYVSSIQPNEINLSWAGLPNNPKNKLLFKTNFVIYFSK